MMIKPQTAKDLRGAQSNALGWGIGSEVLLTTNHLDILNVLGFTVMIQAMNGLGGKGAFSHLLSRAARKIW